MPVDPDYVYADTVHKKTAIDESFRYGCHSRNVGPAPRGETVHWEYQPGLGPDPYCAGCANEE